ncbi:hypothetical protein [Amycolatopsis methanolica]|uniref:Uncharacterized protein n=1 Tax=Amycolatopsis methanolica 239 TaxID=1068978 RepID=A0A076MQI3_AMYME|nr:hypothetical protein [Amycolatopsis methanolica]AIJ23143.1 hypothetical protein AMETH_3051 [Amycolatopsis methanolica 239]
MDRLGDRLGWRRDERLARRRPWLASLTALIAVTAWAGAVGLVIGAVDLDATVTARLPFHSTVFAGISLGVLIAVPMTVVTWFAARRDPRTSPAAVVAGTVLIGWIAVEVGIVRTFNVLQPVCVLAGLVLLVAGLRDFGRGRDR